MLNSIDIVSSLNARYSQARELKTNAVTKTAINQNKQELQSIPLATYQAYALTNGISFRGKLVNKQSLKGFSQEFRMPVTNKTQFKNFDNVLEHYSDGMKVVISNFKNRMNKEGQFLKWVELPKNQMKKNENGISHLDEIVAQADELRSRKNPDGSERSLVVLGIGGSKHTAEFLASMAGVGNIGKLHFYSDIDPVSFKNFIKETGDNVKGLNFLVVSKSGTTFETADAFKKFENALTKAYKADGLSQKKAELKAQEHFAICTDATATEKNMRGKIGSVNGLDNNYIKELYIHDDVGGRYSMFDDPSLFALSYAGVSKDYITKVLKGADRVSKLALNEDVKNNPAAQGAIFNTFSRDNGYNLVQHNFYGGLFKLGAENWTKQLYLESLKDFDYAVGKAPDSMHYATEGQFKPSNRDKYNTVMTIMDPEISQNYKRYTGALAATYNETTPLLLETLKLDGERIKPEAIGEYIQNTHFKTVFEGMLRRQVAGIITLDVLPEVLQPSVEAYKNKFKPGSPFELKAGE